ncbi:MAG TPA: hypothetical protein VFY76_17060 [Nocardioides sp.]|nr:hypothetical protein [Nocardioides sp.]
MAPSTRPIPPGGPHLWADHLWPVVSGTLAGIGTIGAAQTYGVLGALALYGSLAVFTSVTLYCVAAQASLPVPAAVRWGLTAPLVLLCVLGLAHVLSGYGLVAALGVAVTSPLALRTACRLRPYGVARAGEDPGTPAVSARTVRLQQEAVRRQFEEMVSHLDDPDEPS